LTRQKVNGGGVGNRKKVRQREAEWSIQGKGWGEKAVKRNKGGKIGKKGIEEKTKPRKDDKGSTY